MSEKPILFTAEMIRAKREGRKTVTCRVITPQPTKEVGGHSFDAEIGDVVIFTGTPCVLRESRGRDKAASGDLTPVKLKPPYQVGDLLWVKEAWWDLGHMEHGKWSGRTQSHTVKPRYVADCPDPFIEGIGGVIQPVKIPWKQTSPHRSTWRKRSSRFMPKWAARTWLEVVSVRAERSDEGLWVWRYEFKEYLRQGSEDNGRIHETT